MGCNPKTDTQGTGPKARLLLGLATLYVVLAVIAAGCVGGRQGEVSSPVSSTPALEPRIPPPLWVQDTAQAREAVRRSPTGKVERLHLGVALYRDEQWAAAEKELSAAVAHPKHGVIARYFRALCLELLGRPREAATEFEAVAGELDDSLARGFHFREAGDAWREANDRDRASQAYKKSLENDPTEHVALFGLGCIEADAGNWAAARLHFESALRHSPSPEFSASALAALGLLDEEVGDMRSAVRRYEQALAKNAKNELAQRGLLRSRAALARGGTR